MHRALILAQLAGPAAMLRAGAPLADVTERALASLVRLKASDGPESFAEDDAQLPIIEALATLAVLGLWRQLRDKLIALLGLTGDAAAEFTFDPQKLAAMISDGELFAAAVAAPTGPLTSAQVAGWIRGGRNAAAELQVEWNSDPVQRAIAQQLARIRTAYAEQGLALVRGGVARLYRAHIVAPLAAGEFDGQNAGHIARELRRRFGAGDYNWERLARSEVTAAQASGKLALYQAQGIEKYAYITAGDDRVSAICQALSAAGPYLVADPASPLPMRDSHPNCRCTIGPALTP